MWNLRHWCGYVKYTVGYRNLGYQENIKDWNLNLGQVKVLMFFKTMRLEGEARGHDMHNTMKNLIKFSEADNVYNWGVKLFSCQILCKNVSLKFHIEAS